MVHCYNNVFENEALQTSSGMRMGTDDVIASVKR